MPASETESPPLVDFVARLPFDDSVGVETIRLRQSGFGPLIISAYRDGVTKKPSSRFVERSGNGGAAHCTAESIDADGVAGTYEC
jgi:hypothetical protein